MSKLGIAHHTEQSFAEKTGIPARVTINTSEVYHPEYVKRLQLFSDNAVKLATDRLGVIEKAKTKLTEMAGL